MKNKRELQTEPENTLDFVCSWCEEADLTTEDPKASTQNYGICPSCLRARLEESDTTPASAGVW